MWYLSWHCFTESKHLNSLDIGARTGERAGRPPLRSRGPAGTGVCGCPRPANDKPPLTGGFCRMSTLTVRRSYSCPSPQRARDPGAGGWAAGWRWTDSPPRPHSAPAGSLTSSLHRSSSLTSQVGPTRAAASFPEVLTQLQLQLPARSVRFGSRNNYVIRLWTAVVKLRALSPPTG